MTGVMGYNDAAIFDGWESDFNKVVEDDEIFVAHDASREFVAIDIKSSKTTTYLHEKLEKTHLPKDGLNQTFKVISSLFD
jgi:hypothetical protein